MSRKERQEKGGTCYVGRGTVGQVVSETMTVEYFCGCSVRVGWWLADSSDFVCATHLRGIKRITHVTTFKERYGY